MAYFPAAMSALLDAIRSDAATRLALPAGVHPRTEAGRFQKYLQLETHRLKLAHRKGGGGREVCRARAAVLDELLRHLLEGWRAGTPAAELEQAPRHAVVATGGYGRGELNPSSDLDVMFLYEGPPPSPRNPPWFLGPIAEGFLFDLGLRVGHFARTIADCVRVANAELQVKTSLLEARLVCGDAPLFERLERVMQAKCVRGHEHAYLEARLADQQARRAKFGNAVCLQEPNVKNGCGGLRDYQNLLWMACFKYGSRTLSDLRERDLIGADEEKTLEQAYDFLLRVRNELHYHTGRAADVLTRNLQPAIAHNLGYHERSLSRRVERFMGHYYSHARQLHLITRTLEERLALLPQPRRLPRLKDFLRERRRNASYVVDGFKFVDGAVVAAQPTVFAQQPARLMRVFRHAQQRGLTLHPELAQSLRNELHRVDRHFRADPHVHKTFLEILNQRGNVAPTLRRMHEVGLLGAFLPCFGKLTCRVQHEFFHQYTIDEHTLVCLEKLDRIWAAKEPPLGPYAEVFAQVERPYLLYLAMLLHDTGKSSDAGRHADTGSRMAASVARRLGLEPSEAQTLRHLVQHHLTMVLFSQRRDLDDPGEIRRFAAEAPTMDLLNQLTLITVADSLATSDKLWNGFKDTLLWTLYRRAAQVLSGSAEFLRAEEQQRERLEQQVRELLGQAVGAAEVPAHFASLPPRYFLLRGAAEIAEEIRLIHRFLERQLCDRDEALEPVTAWHHEPDRGYSLVRVCTWDRPGLFSLVAGTLTAAGLNILSAEIFTRQDNIALDTFYVTAADTGALADPAAVRSFERLLQEVALGKADVGERIRTMRRAQPLYRADHGEPPTTRIRFDNQSSETRTILEVETEDRVGLLHALSSALFELGVDISVAKIATDRGSAFDTFYVSDRNQPKIVDPQRQRQIEAALRAALPRLE